MIPPIYSPEYQNQCCASNIGGCSLLYSSLFSSFEVPSSKSPLLTFPFWGDPRKLTFVLSFSKASRFHFFRPTFWLLSLLSFFPSELIPFCQAERSQATFLHGSSSWVPQSTKPLLMSCWFPSPLTPLLGV